MGGRADGVGEFGRVWLVCTSMVSVGVCSFVLSDGQGSKVQVRVQVQVSRSRSRCRC